MSAVTYRSMMSSTDALIWNIESDPQLRSTVMIAWQLDSVPTPERMQANVDRMVAAIPRLRQRVVDGEPRPSWVHLGEIDLEHHVVTERLPAVSNFRDVLAFAERWVAEPFDRDRPLWRLALLEGLPEGRCGVVIKVHHAIADGMGMLLMLGNFTDLEADPPAAEPVTNVIALPDPRRPYSSFGRVSRKAAAACSTFAKGPKDATLDAWRTLASAGRLVVPHRTPHSRVMTARSGALRFDTRDVPLRVIKDAAKRHDASINDVFVTIVGDALRRYHERLGADCERLRVHVPVNSRTDRTADLAGNDFVPARISLSIGPASVDSIPSVRDQLTDLRSEPALDHINSVSAAVQRLGRSISRWVIGGMMKGVDVLASNMPGPPFALYLAGSRIERFAAFGPPAGAAVNVTLFTYDGEACFGISSDVAAIPDHRALLACFDEALDEFVEMPRRHLVAV